MKTEGKIRSGTHCKCKACGYEGYAYGMPAGKIISAPWCQNCGRNNQLVKTGQP